MGYGCMYEVYGYVWGMGVCMRYGGMCMDSCEVYGYEVYVGYVWGMGYV